MESKLNKNIRNENIQNENIRNEKKNNIEKKKTQFIVKKKFKIGRFLVNILYEKK